ncbi:MAG: hypothetical protein J0L92_25900, partial [Deltaproteobacteria bacterium]|nr:hypothetical protein [Deltaproteobacteria bacterium]
MSLLASRPSFFTASSHVVIASLGAMALLALAACDNRNSGVRCTPGCSSVQMCCANSTTGNRCVDHFSDPANCGACGNVCAAGQLCVNRMCMTTSSLPDAGPVDAPFVGRDAPITGSCSPSCGVGFNCCGTTCVAADGAGGTSDPSFSNCGACGRVCDSDEANRCARFGSTTQCMCGSGPRCDASLGETCVLGTSGDYECLRNDLPENCGTPPVACNSGETCEAGECVCGTLGRPCPEGESCTNTGGTSSCRDFSSDRENCGSAGNACQPGEDCVDSACVCPGAGRACMAGGGGMIP